MIVSCYTHNYKEHADKLKASLEALNLPHIVSEIPDQGGWDKNTKYKPHFILSCLQNYPYVVWTDADSIVRRPPVLFDKLTCDVAFHRFKNIELLSGTVYFRNTENTNKLLNQWIAINNKKPKVWDQKNLDAAVKITDGLNVGSLPLSYCCIYDLGRRQQVNVEPVIEHFQASRQLK